MYKIMRTSDKWQFKVIQGYRLSWKLIAHMQFHVGQNRNFLSSNFKVFRTQ